MGPRPLPRRKRKNCNPVGVRIFGFQQAAWPLGYAKSWPFSLNTFISRSQAGQGDDEVAGQGTAVRRVPRKSHQLAMILTLAADGYNCTSYAFALIKPEFAKSAYRAMACPTP